MPFLKDINPCLSTTIVDGLSRQIIGVMKSVTPEILIDCSDLNISINSKQFPFLQQSAKNGLAKAINHRGRRLKINSAYRTCAQQFLLRLWWEQSKCGIQAAAKPGSSSHESGLALDISDPLGWRPYLEAQGWDWFGPRDRPHFQFLGAHVPIKGQGVFAFQKLWNQNHLNDQIDTDGSYGVETKARLRMSPSEGFGNIAGSLTLRVLQLSSPFLEGGDIRRVQLKLKTLGFLDSDSDVDGKYGPNTEKAVREFQEDMGLTSDGIIGSKTYEKLGIQ